MTDNTENTTPAAGAGGLPTAPASQTQGTPSSPVDAVTLEALHKAVTMLTGEVNALKSGKDKGIAKVATKVNDLEETIKQYEKYRQEYQTPDKALREMKVDAMLSGRENGSYSTDVLDGKSGNSAQPAGVDYTGFINAMGLQANDAEVVAAITTGGETLDVINRLTDLANKRRQSPKPPAQPSPLPSSGGGTLPGEETLDDVTAKLDVAMSQPIQDMPLVRELRKRQLALLNKPR